MRARRLNYCLNLLLLSAIFLLCVRAEAIIGLPENPPQLVTTRWPDSAMAGDQNWYRLEGGRYKPIFAIDVRFHRSDYCESLLVPPQLFALETYIRNAHMEAREKALLLANSHRLNPAQVFFTEMFEEITGPALHEPRDIAAERGDFSPIHLPYMQAGRMILTRATLWSIASQTPGANGRMIYHSLPWQLDPNFAGVELDRSIFRMAWELGRGAQNQADSIDTLLSANLLAMYQEVLANNESLEHAYVFMHALGPAQARLFAARRHPQTGDRLFQPHISHGTDNASVVFVARLSNLLDSLPPNQFSQRLNEVIEASGRRIGWAGAADHIMSLYRAMREDLDFVHPENPPERFPIIVRDTTEFTGWFMALASRRHGIFENGGPEVARALSRNRWLDTGYRGSHIIDEEIVPARELARHKLVGISNLNPSLASRDPDYTRLVLAAVYLRYKKRLLDSYPLQTPQILTMLRFAISSSHDDITKQANLIPGHEVVPMTWEETSIRIDANYGAIRTAPRMNMTLGPSFVFSSAAIEALLASNPRLARQAQGSLRSGAFQVRQLLDRPL